MCQSGHLASHLRHLRIVHAERRRMLFEALRQHTAGMLDFDDVPEAGLRVAARLPEHVDDRVVIADCLALGIKLECLSNCYKSWQGPPGLLIGFGSTPEAEIAPAVERLGEVLRAHCR